MKKFLCLCAAILAMSISFSYADPMGIDGIAIVQHLGVGAEFDASPPGTITWSGGVDGWLMTEMGNFQFYSWAPGFESAPVTAEFTLITDLSSGGQAKARFAAGSWTMGVIASGYTDPVAYLAGHIQGNYNEMATNPPEGTALEGRAIAIVDTATFNDAYWTLAIGTPICWEGIGQAAGIIANISLDEGKGIQNYQSDYSSNNVIVTLYADPSVVPEPATIALLTLGGLLLRKRS
ncbi:MAG: PEP-CTERM sorting domain-containing protein [Sedimentisphaerales bacterium]